MSTLLAATEAYIVKNEKLIAIVTTDLKAGTVVQYSSLKCFNRLDANREFDLVNAEVGTISRARKFYNQTKQQYIDVAVRINETNKIIPEFYI